MIEGLRIPRLETQFGGGTVLEKAGVDVRIDRLFSVVTVEQAWRNPTKRNFEVVYTFPVAPGATLLEFEVRIGGRRLVGRAVEKVAAAERYEDAIAERRRAVLLEEAEDGLYTVSIGNLGPGETVVVRYACAEVLRRQGEAVRFCLPTVIAPRYGHPALEPHQQPEHDLLDGPDRRYALAVTVSGPLADVEWHCPTHEVRRRRVKDGLRIAPVRPALMDRDFVLECRDPGAGAGAVLDQDVDGWTVLASFRPDSAVRADERPRALKVLLDCSGSMTGDAIDQARLALGRILDELGPGDRFNVVRFGSSHQPLFRVMMRATPANVERARAALGRLEADLGGTELAAALDYTLRMPSREDGMPADVLLITDGEVWSDRAAVLAGRAGQRVFAVGVGSAPNAALINRLAEASGGAAEYATPGESIGERIVRQFRRMRAPQAKRASVSWPGTPEEVVPAKLPAVYLGDTVVIGARFRNRPRGAATLKLEFGDGTCLEQSARVEKHGLTKGGDSAPGPVARFAAAARLRALTDRQAKAGVELATRYNLVSRFTSHLVVDTAVARKGLKDPELMKIAQMTAAGWHGLGTVAEVRDSASSRPMFFRRAPAESDTLCFLRRAPVDASDAPGQEVREEPPAPSLPGYIVALNAAPPATPDRLPTLDELERQGLAEEWLTALWGLVADGEEEKLVVLLFLDWLARTEDGVGLTDEARAALAAMRAAVEVPSGLEARFAAALAG